MNQYGLALTTPSKQTILPAMSSTGLVYGFYPIATTTFTGTETEFALPEGSVPIKSVTLSTNQTVTQYMAAIFDTKSSIVESPNVQYYAQNKPWEGYASFIDGADGYYRWWSLPSETWMLHFGYGTLLTALTTGMKESHVVTPVTPPVVTPSTITWRGSVEYKGLLGECSFFDFNWVTQFAVSSKSNPVRITVVSNPPPEAPATITALKAVVVGIPTATANGNLYDTIRIMRLDEVKPGTYEFKFKVYDDTGASTPVDLTLTVK